MQSVPYQSTALDVWAEKYAAKAITGEQMEFTMEESYHRVAKALSMVELPESQAYWEALFYKAMAEYGAIPGGRITSNVGLDHRKNVSAINCVVSGTIKDSIDGINRASSEARTSLAAGCGIGYEFSTLRPRGAWISGVGAGTSGAVSFMGDFDAMCFNIASAGGRRGAQMATFDVSHPDIEEFIKAKREDGRLRQFNLSVLMSEAFMRAVAADANWPLVFPYTLKEIEVTNPYLGDVGTTLWKPWPVTDNYLVRDGLVACKVYRVVKAKYLWDLVMDSTYDFAEPGCLFIDRINDMNNLFWDENQRATNPCGEQNLPPYGSCLLGSINLTKFVRKPFTEEAKFDLAAFRDAVVVFSRMLDNVVEINGLRVPEQEAELRRKRRHGMGITGLGSACALLCMRYGSEAAVEFTSKVCQVLAEQSYATGVELAKEKGSAPILLEFFTLDNLPKEDQSNLAEILKSKGAVRDEHKGWLGKDLMAFGSLFLRNFPEKLKQDISQYGCRYSHATSIAPTGTMSLTWGNNCSNGMEPSFSHKYTRNKIVPGKNSKEAIEVYSYELLAYRHLVNPEADPFVTEGPNKLPDYFAVTDDLTPSDHIRMQAAAQMWVDSAISKTCNVPTDISKEDFKDIYKLAHQSGLKGFTTFRFNPEAFQGVLVNSSDLEATSYTFNLEDGSSVTLKGNEQVEYEGEVHSAANLYDALKEGYYGKF